MSMKRSRDTAFAKHQREMAQQVYLPLAITVLVLILVMVGIVIALKPYQIGTVSAFMSLLVLIPAVIVCLVPYALLVALAALLSKFNRWLPGRFVYVLSAVHSVNVAIYQLARRVASPIIWIHQRYAWLEHVVSSRIPKSVPLLPRSVNENEQ